MEREELRARRVDLTWCIESQAGLVAYLGSGGWYGHDGIRVSYEDATRFDRLARAAEFEDVERRIVG